LAYNQSDLQAARNKERKIKQLPTSIPKNIKLEILQKFIFTCKERVMLRVISGSSLISFLCISLNFTFNSTIFNNHFIELCLQKVCSKDKVKI
jgi:hypothetical protein